MLILMKKWYHLFTASGKIFFRHEAWGGTAPAQEMKADTDFVVAHDAQQIAVHTADAKANVKIGTAVYAFLVSYRRAACVYIKQLFMGLKAKAIAAPGRIARYVEAIKVGRTSKAIAADSSIAASRDNAFLLESEAVGCTAPAIDTTVESIVVESVSATAIPAAVTAMEIQKATTTTHGAKMATWIEPVVIDGVLYLRQAYSATVENGVLVVR